MPTVLRTLILIIKSYCIEICLQIKLVIKLTVYSTTRRMLFWKLKLNSPKQRSSKTKWSFNFAVFVKRSIRHVLNTGNVGNWQKYFYISMYSRLPYFHRIHWKQKMQTLTDLQMERIVCRFSETPNIKKSKRKEKKDSVSSLYNSSPAVIKFISTRHN